MKLEQHTLLRLRKEILSVEEAFYLYLLLVEEEISKELWENLNITKLKERGLLAASETLTDSGKALILSFIDERPPVTMQMSEAFEKFWKTFPASDAFGPFQKTRILRLDKTKTYVAYQNALKKTTPEKLQKALEIDIANKNAVRGENPFKYMKGSPRWLSDGVWEEIEEDKPMTYETDELM